MTYELLQKGPAVYVPALLFSLAITLLVYGVFPVIFARTRKKEITQKKYTLICYGVNFLAMVVFFSTANGMTVNIAPCLLWTSVFTASGVKILKQRGVLEGFRPIDRPDRSESAEKPQACCPKCGFRLFADSAFCSKCGSAVVEMKNEED